MTPIFSVVSIPDTEIPEIAAYENICDAYRRGCDLYLERMKDLHYFAGMSLENEDKPEDCITKLQKEEFEGRYEECNNNIRNTFYSFQGTYEDLYIEDEFFYVVVKKVNVIPKSTTGLYCQSFEDE